MYYWCNLLSGNPLDQGKFSLLAESINIGNNNNNNSAAGHDIGGRNAIEFFSNLPTFGDVASAAGHDIGGRNAIEFF